MTEAGGAGEGTGPGLLHAEETVGEGEGPKRWLLLAHGIFGAGRNWRTVARRTVERRAEWAAALLDLRLHGESQGFSPPHTLAACADDVRGWVRATGRRPGALLGHSFGGKVVLRYLREAGRGGREAAEGGGSGGDRRGRRQAWIVDSTPSAREPGGSAWRMLKAARGLPDRYGSRDEAVEGLQEAGFARPVARWMTTNLERTEGPGGGSAYRWRLDWDEMEELLLDFFRTDLWPVLEDPPSGWEIRVVRAEGSEVLTGEELRRLRELEARTGRVRLHALPGGHWLNADNPDGMTALLADGLPG